ncbi:MAG: RNA polymerase factor sigma-54 [Candidatus Eisenbacteria bacterium]
MRHELRQKLVMTPKLQQAIKLLQVPALELQQILKEELTVNPLLEEPEDGEDEVQEEEVPDDDGEDEGEFKASEAEIEWDRYLKDGFEMGSRASGEREEIEEGYERVPVVKHTLEDHLMSQLRIATDLEESIKIGEFIIGSLDRNGFLTISTEEIARLLSVDEDVITRVHSLIKTFDPPGIGAADLRECLMIQLSQDALEDSLAWVLVKDHLDDFLQKRYPDLARRLHKTVGEVQTAADVIAKYDPRPGTRYSSDEPRYIVPDLVIENVEGEYIVQLNDRNVPRLRISRAYKDILSNAKSRTKKEREYVVEKLNSARWLIRTIDQRRRTMIKVMEAILEVQREFFDKGVEHLRPLTLQQIAERVDMHESTVSRVTNSKYVQTPRGVLELKYFFSTGLRSDNGEVASSKMIKARLSEAIEKEDKHRPLSDQELADMLKREGLNVARRTVAKYRDQLEILPARIRKQY